jgi:hypothetical protein
MNCCWRRHSGCFDECSMIGKFVKQPRLPNRLTPHAFLRDLPHSRQALSNRGVMRPHEGQIR